MSTLTDFTLGDGSTAGAEARSRASRTGWLIGVVVVTLVVVGVLALIRAPSSDRPLSSDNAGEDGARAVAQILRVQGVQVTEVATLASVTAAAGSEGTLVIAHYSFLSIEQIASVLAHQGPVVWLYADPYDLDFIRPYLGRATGPDALSTTPGCDDPAAIAAGTIDTGRQRVTVSTATRDATVCFPDFDDYSGLYVRFARQGAGDIIVVGDAEFATNAKLDSEGNAALALHLLGSRASVAWYVADPWDTSVISGESSDGVVLHAPAWMNAALAAAVAALSIAALWRGRRFGRLIVEPLPVVVPASEATRGRARLYLRSRAHGHAAAALRAGAAHRMVRSLGIARHADRAAITGAIASASHLTEADIDLLLYGPAPQDEAAMMELVRRLDALESEVAP